MKMNVRSDGSSPSKDKAELRSDGVSPSKNVRKYDGEGAVATQGYDGGGAVATRGKVTKIAAGVARSIVRVHAFLWVHM